MLTKKDAGMFEPPKAVSFQRPVNNEKHKGARRDGTVGVPFLVRFWASKNEQPK
jgi:hypothetical protein